jgi:hypothetical protein
MNRNKTTTEREVQDQSKRDFLKKSSYAAYMAPAMLTLVVENASAAKSDCRKPNGGAIPGCCRNNPDATGC